MADMRARTPGIGQTTVGSGPVCRSMSLEGLCCRFTRILLPTVAYQGLRSEISGGVGPGSRLGVVFS